MEIEQLRKEINQILANITEHSERFTGKEYLPSLEVSVLMSKINKLQELSAVLKYKIQQKEENRRSSNKQPQAVEIKEPTPIIEKTPEPVIEDTLEQELKAETEQVVESRPVAQEIKIEKTSPTKTTKSSVSDKFLHTPISSLKDAFSLNDRYLFANELFKKDMALFNDTVKAIDSCSSLIEAQEILTKTNATLNWDTENERVISFYQLVERRFL
ncbi:MAG: hypothetical protein KDD24_01455 [Flavobacteriales bacterium]|nr:hypothetical protein [Flavobacteriales bacterium]MCB9174491.1 hypothetical protein [Flavobacteriales bacterium]